MQRNEGMYKGVRCLGVGAVGDERDSRREKGRVGCLRARL